VRKHGRVPTSGFIVVKNIKINQEFECKSSCLPSV